MSIAVIIPAYNEESTVDKVMREFFEFDRDLEIYVIDNNSTDDTRTIALETYKELGCKGSLLTEKRQGKSQAVKKAFSEVDADYYIMIDADLTYGVKDLSKLIEPVRQGLADMTVGNRHFENGYQKENKRPFHNFGNTLVRKLINFFFKSNLIDILSGYRCFSKIY